MRRMLMVAASAAVVSLFGAAGASAANLAGPGIRSAADALGGVQQVRRVCREVCRDGYCRQRCWEEPGYRERRVYREYDDPPPQVYYDRPRYYDPAPGVGFSGPGFSIGVGPGW